MSAYHQLPDIPVLGFAACSGTGKTTLLEKLIPLLNQKKIKSGVYKHSHHVVELDRPGKDSYRLRKAGALQTLLATPERSILTTELPADTQNFYQRLHQFDIRSLDIILVEGCKEQQFPKIELHRNATGNPWLYLQDPDIVAIATDTDAEADIPVLNLNNIDEIAIFIEGYIKTFTARTA